MSDRDPAIIASVRDAKSLLGAMSGIFALYMPLPDFNRVVPIADMPHFVFVLIVVTTLGTAILLISRGMLCLLRPELSEARIHAIRLGFLVVLVLLALTPWSLKLALLNRELHPTWILRWSGSAAVLLTYSYLAFVHWRRLRSAT